jgi:hypothetical protein
MIRDKLGSFRGPSYLEMLKEFVTTILLSEKYKMSSLQLPQINSLALLNSELKPTLFIYSMAGKMLGGLQLLVQSFNMDVM